VIGHDVAYWHIAEVLGSAAYFRFWGVKLTLRALGDTAAFDPLQTWAGRADG